MQRMIMQPTPLRASLEYRPIVTRARHSFYANEMVLENGGPRSRDPGIVVALIAVLEGGRLTFPGEVPH